MGTETTGAEKRLFPHRKYDMGQFLMVIVWFFVADMVVIVSSIVAVSLASNMSSSPIRYYDIFCLFLGFEFLLSFLYIVLITLILCFYCQG